MPLRLSDHRYSVATMELESLTTQCVGLSLFIVSNDFMNNTTWLKPIVHVTKTERGIACNREFDGRIWNVYYS